MADETPTGRPLAGSPVDAAGSGGPRHVPPDLRAADGRPDALLAFTLVLAAVVLALLVFFWWTGAAFAGGQATVRWDQGADCGQVVGWELLQAPVTATGPTPVPSMATVGASIPNDGTPACGMAMQQTVTLVGIGPQRFWLRAVGANGVKSAESGSVDASLPLARPSGLSLAIP